MQNSGAFQYLAIDTVHESATNPRRTFNESKLQELAESIRHPEESEIISCSIEMPRTR